jgi:hypothetical protein
LQHTHHPELRAELARLIAEEATPELLAEAESGTRGLPSDREASERLHRALEQIVSRQKLRLARQRLDRIYPSGPFKFDPLGFDNAMAFGVQFAEQLQQYRALFRKDGFQFSVSLTSGLLADLSYLDHATLAHRLEAIRAEEALAAGRLAETLLPLRNMFHIQTQLASLKHVATRLTAAKLRAESLRVVDAVVNHPQTNNRHRRAVLELVDSAISQWPPDVDAWIGDRAMGLHMYEMVRDGQLLNVLTSDEIRGLREERDLEAFVSAVLHSLDEDQWFYLSAMREVIDSCHQPFFQRKHVLKKIRARMAALRDTPRYPLLAARVLLKDLESGHQTQALDRARCEAWSLALAAATGRTVADPWINPVMGEPYRLAITDDAVVIEQLEGDDGDESVRVSIVTDNRRDNRYTSD